MSFFSFLINNKANHYTYTNTCNYQAGNNTYFHLHSHGSSQFVIHYHLTPKLTAEKPQIKHLIPLAHGVVDMLSGFGNPEHFGRQLT